MLQERADEVWRTKNSVLKNTSVVINSSGADLRYPYLTQIYVIPDLTNSGDRELRSSENFSLSPSCIAFDNCKILTSSGISPPIASRNISKMSSLFCSAASFSGLLPSSLVSSGSTLNMSSMLSISLVKLHPEHCSGWTQRKQAMRGGAR